MTPENGCAQSYKRSVGYGKSEVSSVSESIVSLIAPQVSVIIPACNEALCIGAVLEELFAVINADTDFPPCEVIVVDNASSDDTACIARESGALVVTEPRLGYGQSCWTGVQASHGDILLFLDADGSACPDKATQLLAIIDAGADLVVATRHCGKRSSMSFAQCFGNDLAVRLIRLLWRIPVTDLGPFRAIRRDTFYALDMVDRRFGWTVEMQVKAYRIGARVVDVPVAWRDRIAGQSKISGTVSGVLGAGVGIIGMIARLWLYERLNRRWRAHAALIAQQLNARL